MSTASQPPQPQSSEFLRSLALGALVGLAGLAISLPILRQHGWHHAATAPKTETTAAARPAPPPAAPAHGPLADFQGTAVSPAVRQVANWAFFTRDNQRKSVVIIDKQAATVYAFSPAGKLVASTPALVGLAHGDDAEPGIGDKPLPQVRDDEKVTQAGRFVAAMGENSTHEDIVWIDYDSGLAMHRVINTDPSERRLQRLASPDPLQRRISFGCVNLPPQFYEQVLSPIVKKTGAIVYVVPEVHSLAEVFGAWDVTDPDARPPARPAPHAVAAVATATSQPRQLRDGATPQ